MSDRPIIVISGTNRPGSSTSRIARLVHAHHAAAGGCPAEMLDLTELPLEVFHPSSYASKPPAMVALQQRILNSGGLHIVTPEYNGSFPGVLKYFIDMLKFPESFERKPVAFVGVASGIWGALRAVEQLQLVFGYRNAHVYPERVFISGVSNKLDGEGKLKDIELDQRLARQASGFSTYVRLFADSIT